jgi:hypothetical protein
LGDIAGSSLDAIGDAHVPLMLSVHRLWVGWLSLRGPRSSACGGGRVASASTCGADAVVHVDVGEQCKASTSGAPRHHQRAVQRTCDRKCLTASPMVRAAWRLKTGIEDQQSSPSRPWTGEASMNSTASRRLLFCFHAGDHCLARRDQHRIFARCRPPQSWDFVPFRREEKLRLCSGATSANELGWARSSIDSCRPTTNAAIISPSCA